MHFIFSSPVLWSVFPEGDLWWLLRCQHVHIMFVMPLHYQHLFATFVFCKSASPLDTEAWHGLPFGSTSPRFGSQQVMEKRRPGVPIVHICGLFFLVGICPINAGGIVCVISVLYHFLFSLFKTCTWPYIKKTKETAQIKRKTMEFWAQMLSRSSFPKDSLNKKPSPYITGTIPLTIDREITHT